MLDEGILKQVVATVGYAMGIPEAEWNNLNQFGVDGDEGYRLTLNSGTTIGFVESSGAGEAMEVYDHIVVIDEERKLFEFLPGFLYGEDPLRYGFGVDREVVYRDFSYEADASGCCHMSGDVAGEDEVKGEPFDETDEYDAFDDEEV